MVDVVEEITGGRKVRKEYEDGELVRVTVEPLSEPGPMADAPESSGPERRGPQPRATPSTSFFGRFTKQPRADREAARAPPVEKTPEVETGAPEPVESEPVEAGPVESEPVASTPPVERRSSFLARFRRKPKVAPALEDDFDDPAETEDDALPDMLEVDAVDDVRSEPASAWEVEADAESDEPREIDEPAPVGSEEPRPAGGLLARLRRRREALESDDDLQEPAPEDEPALALVDEPAPEPVPTDPERESELAIEKDVVSADESWDDPVPEAAPEVIDDAPASTPREEVEPVEVGAAEDWEPDADAIVAVAAPVEEGVPDVDADLPSFIVDFDEPEPAPETVSRVADVEFNREIVRGFLARNARKTRESVSRPVPDQPYSDLLPKVEEKVLFTPPPVMIEEESVMEAEEDVATPVAESETRAPNDVEETFAPVEVEAVGTSETIEPETVEPPLAEAANDHWMTTEVEAPATARWQDDEEPVAEAIAHVRYVEVPHDLELRVDHVLATYASKTSRGMSAGYEELAIRVDSLTHRHGRSELAERVDALIAEREGARGGPVLVTTNEDDDAIEVPVRPQPRAPAAAPADVDASGDAFAGVKGLPENVAALLHDAGFADVAALGAADAVVLTAALKRVAEARGVTAEVKLSEARAWGWIRAAQKAADRE